VNALALCVLAQFVGVRDGEFVLSGRTFRFVGANIHVMHGAEARRRAEETIAAAAADGLRVGRVWALGEGPADAPDWQRRDLLFRAGPEGWRPEAFAQLDRVVALARRHGLRLIVTLANSWPDYGGLPQYLAWAGHDDDGSYGFGDRFYTDPRARAWYLEHVERIVTRYRDEPTVMAWELLNEAQGTEEAAPARLAFFRDALRFVKRHDPNHLVSPGLLGYARTWQREEWLRVMSLPEVDYCDQHVWPQDNRRLRSGGDLDRFLDDRAQLARYVVRKPLVIGEFGFRGEGRARWHRRLLDRLLFDGAAGALVWIYQPLLDTEREFRIPIERPRDAVRHELSRAAKRFATAPPPGNPLLSAARGTSPIFPSHATLAGQTAPAGRWARTRDGLTLRIPPESFSTAFWEEAGVYRDAALVHAWGAGSGRFEYRFARPPEHATGLRVRARVSSEYPGGVAPSGGTTRFRLLLDGAVIGERVAPPDDGIGTFVEASGALGPGPAHALTFEVADGPFARGLCIYGAEGKLNREPVDDPEPITLTALPDAPASSR
jgi:mannan endo-1,4-beta-mannosidase